MPRSLILLLPIVVLAAIAQPAEAVTPAELAGQLNAQIARCWNPPPKARGSVAVSIEFNQDGRIVGTPKASGLASTGVAKSAVEAVQYCQPYRLPPSMFSIWQHTTVRLSVGN
ncbi:MAG TPA: hypothetical protein VL418_07080 [Devosiaceae bacterium]|jgi:hypothetical protein|nr:hypothetical protein [Devosiaceae bacterium]